MNAPGEKKTNLQPFELLLDQAVIARRIVELGEEITRDYAGKVPLLVGVLKGCFVFLSDLMREINLPLEVDFLSAASYRNGTEQDQELYFDNSIRTPIKGRHVLIVEGVVDSGRTVSSLLSKIGDEGPESVEVVTLIDKPGSHRFKLDIRYKGFSIGNEFVIGFGLDNAQKYRNLPFIGRVVEK
ncbi:MAG: hypoxanthine phosphoribosyltransferase [candidate division Zixibacteria bacterium]|nr:hypoxanthine phosphoribosyltransferase [candidate division Zixibacteria bacterium]